MNRFRREEEVREEGMNLVFDKVSLICGISDGEKARAWG